MGTQNRKALPKLGSLDDHGTEQSFYYPHCWERQQTSGPERICIAPHSNQIDLLEELSEGFVGPSGILYVLVVPRGSGTAGRHQMARPMERIMLESFLARDRRFFEEDARHHLWIADVTGQDQIVYDRHNVIYAYGTLERFERVLRSRGLREGKVAVPVPHVHHYHGEYDEAERSILEEYDWIFSPLRPEDDD